MQKVTFLLQFYKKNYINSIVSFGFHINTPYYLEKPSCLEFTALSKLMAEQYPQMPSAFYGQKPVALMNFNNVQTTTVQSKSAQHNQRLKAKSANSKSRKPINDSSISDYSNSNNFVQQIPPTKSQLNYSTSRGIPNNYSGDHLVGLNGPENMTREGSARLERDPKGQGSGQFAEYHKFTWGISPNSSITSGSCHQALRKVSPVSRILQQKL